MGSFRHQANEKADKQDIVALFSEYVNLPQSFSSATNPTLAAYLRFISDCDSNGGKFDWDAASEAASELCDDGKLPTLKQFKAVYYKRARSTTGANGCEECGQTGIVNAVAHRHLKNGTLHAIDSPQECMAYVVAIPCRCPKGRILQDSFGMDNRAADHAFAKRRTREMCFAIARECVSLYHGNRGIKPFKANNSKNAKPSKIVGSVFGLVESLASCE